MENFLAIKVYEALHNNYSNKAALDLMNEFMKKEGVTDIKSLIGTAH